MRTPTASPADRFQLQRRPSLWVPDSANAIEEAEEISDRKRHELKQSLDDGWREAVREFKRKTDRDLVISTASRESVLKTLSQSVHADSKKKQDIQQVLDKVLAGVELIGSVAAQAASMVFAPAGMCFNALEILISIPRAIQDAAADLQKLFAEVTSFLCNFQIYRDIDRRSMLDATLIKSTNDILLALVDVCALAITTVDHRKRFILSKVFLKDERVKDALETFRDLVDKQSKLTTTLTLEATLDNKELSRSILQSSRQLEENVKDNNLMLRELHKYSIDSKTTKVNRERLTNIERGLGTSESVLMGPVRALDRLRDDLFDTTLSVLESHQEYEKWKTDKHRRKLLLLVGDSSTGKTQILSALKRKFDDQIAQLKKDEPSAYVAYYAFSRADDTMSKPDGQHEGTRAKAPLKSALRSMAYQIARQSTAYAAFLEKLLRTEDFKAHQRSTKDIWNLLNFSDFECPPDSVLYLFFDGLDQLKTGVNELIDISRGITSRRNPEQDHRLRFRIIFTDKERSKWPGEANIPVVLVKDINAKLVRQYLDDEMGTEGIFQDGNPESEKRRERLVDELTKYSKGSFAVASQKLKIVKDAIEDDEDEDQIMYLLQTNSETTQGEQGRIILDTICDRLTRPHHREQLKELLMWSVYARDRPYLDELEAALYLQRQKHSTELLTVKLKERFEGVFTISDDDVVVVNEKVEDHLLWSLPAYPSLDIQKPSNISLKVSIQNGAESAVRQFFWDLNAAISSGKFDFSSDQEIKNEMPRILFSSSEAHFTIATRCLKALNDDKVRDHASPLIIYAAQSLPRHLDSLAWARADLSLSDAKLLGQELVNFLADYKIHEDAWDVTDFRRLEWFDDMNNVQSIRTILTEPKIVNELEPIQRRWVTQRVEMSGWAPFFKNMVLAAAYKWLQDHKRAINPYYCFDFIDGYLDLLDRKDRAYEFTIGDWERQFDGTQTPPQFDSRSPLADAVLPHVSGNPSTAGLAQLSEPKPELQRRNSVLSPSMDKPVDQNFPTRIHEENGIVISPITNVDVSSLAGDVMNTEPLDGGSISSHSHRSTGNLRDSGSTQESVDTEVKAEQSPPEIVAITAESNEHNDTQILAQQGTEDNAETVMEEAGPLVSRSGTLPEMSFKDRVERALEWSLVELKIQLDAYAYERIGYTLLNHDDDAAIEYFEKARGGKDDQRTIIGLSSAWASKHEWQKAFDVLIPAIESLRSRFKPYEENEDGQILRDRSELFDCLEKAAHCQKEMGNVIKNIEYKAEASKCCPDVAQCRWTLLEVLCQSDQQKRALEVWNDWAERFLEYRAPSPTTYLLDLLRSAPDCSEITPLVQAAKGSELLKHITQTLTKAIDEARQKSQDEDEAYLLYAHGLTLLADGGDDKLEVALQSWTECLSLGQMFMNQNITFQSDFAFRSSARFIARHRFNAAMNELAANSSAAAEVKKDIFTKLEQDIEALWIISHSSLAVVDLPSVCVAVFARECGDIAQTRRILKRDVVDAIEILADGDPYNDATGVSLLTKSLHKSGDLVGALSAWSLLDRITTIRERRTQLLREAARHDDKLRAKLEAENYHLFRAEDESEAAKRVKDDDIADELNCLIEDKDLIQKFKDEGWDILAIVRGDTSEPAQEQNQGKPAGIDTSDTDTSAETHHEQALVRIRSRPEPMTPLSASSSDSGPIQHSLMSSCDGCDKDIESSIAKNVWFCNFCPSLFCTECKEKLERGRTDRFICEPSHTWFQLEHFYDHEDDEYTETVRVGWELVEDETGQRRRDGGRVIKVQDWLEELRVQWDIIKTQPSEERVQR